MSQPQKGLSSTTLRSLAMLLMLIDHLGHVFFPDQLWLRYIGRLAFPIFAFLIVEGYVHTRNFPKYLGRLGLLALVSDLPYQLMVDRTWDYLPFKNVIWTFLIGLAAIFLIDKAKRLTNKPLYYLASTAVFLVAYQVAEVLDTDYHGLGITMLVGFYLLRGASLSQKIGQSLLMLIANLILANLPLLEVVTPETFGLYWAHYGWELISPQYYALLALPIIWTYSGQPGYQSKPLQTISYLFYPLHMVVLGLIALYLGK